MATEDIDLTWRLLLAGWETLFEPHALVGMQVPSTLRALWMQRNAGLADRARSCTLTSATVIRWRNHRMWLLAPRVARVAGLARRPSRGAVLAAVGLALGGDHLAGSLSRGGSPSPRSRLFQLRRAHAGARLRPDHAADVPARRPSTRSPTGSSRQRRRCARRRSPSCAAHAASESCGTSRANRSKQGSESSRTRRPTIADDTTSRYHPPSLALWTTSDSGRCAR